MAEQRSHMLRLPRRPLLRRRPFGRIDVSAVLFSEAGPLPRALAEEIALVLAARNLPHRVDRKGRGWSVSVSTAHAQEAMDELSGYFAENRWTGETRHPGPSHIPWKAAALALAPVLLFFTLTGQAVPGLGLYPETWSALGNADSGLILQGQWWRAVTALTLHADPAHASSNVVVGAGFLAVAAARLGLGRAFLLTILAGVAGNLLNAWLHGPGHLSVGFSTCVFGTAGILAGVHLFGHGGRWRRAWHGHWLVPLGAGLALLGLMGVGGERTDVGAHLFGFAAGLPLGILAYLVGSRLIRPARAGRVEEILTYLAGLALPMLAWWLAFSRGAAS